MAKKGTSFRLSEAAQVRLAELIVEMGAKSATAVVEDLILNSPWKGMKRPVEISKPELPPATVPEIREGKLPPVIRRQAIQKPGWKK